MLKSVRRSGASKTIQIHHRLRRLLSNLTVHSPLLFHKIVESERFALRAAMLDEYQIYLGGGGRFRRKREKLKKINLLASLPRPLLTPDARPVGTV